MAARAEAIAGDVEKVFGSSLVPWLQKCRKNGKVPLSTTKEGTL
jgi:type II secretory pathway component PulM